MNGRQSLLISRDVGSKSGGDDARFAPAKARRSEREAFEISSVDETSELSAAAEWTRGKITRMSVNRRGREVCKPSNRHQRFQMHRGIRFGSSS